MAFSPAEKLGTFSDVLPTAIIYETFLLETDKDGSPDPNPEIYTSFYKYTEQNVIEDGRTNRFDGGTDFIVICYADVLLSYAETLNENGKTEEAYHFVNVVRERSNMEKLSVKQPGLDRDAFRDQYYATFKDGRSEFQPIPQAELDLNENLLQNTGY